MDNSSLFNDPASQLDLDDPETLETIFQAMDRGFTELNGNPNAFFFNSEPPSALPSAGAAESEPVNYQSGNFPTYPYVSPAPVRNGATASSSFTVDNDDLFVPNGLSENAGNSAAMFNGPETQEPAEVVEGAQGLLALAFTNTENPSAWRATATDAALPTFPALPDVGPTGFDDVFGPDLASAPAPAVAARVLATPARVLTRSRSNNVQSNNAQLNTVQPNALQANAAQPNNAPVTSASRQPGQLPVTSALHPRNWTQGTGLFLRNDMDPQDRANRLAILQASETCLSVVPTGFAALEELQHRVTSKGDKHGSKKRSASKSAAKSGPKKKNTMPAKRVPRGTYPATRTLLPAPASPAVQAIEFQATTISIPNLPPSYQAHLSAQSSSGSLSQSPSGIFESGALGNNGEGETPGFVNPADIMCAPSPTVLPSQQQPPPRRRSNPVTSANGQNGQVPASETNAQTTTATHPGPMQPALRIIPFFPRETPDGEPLFVPSGRILCVQYRGYSKMNLFVQHEVGSRTIQCNDDIIIAILPGRILFARIPGAMTNEQALANIDEVTKHIKWAINGGGEERVSSPSSTASTSKLLHLYLLSPTDAHGNPGYCVASATSTATPGPELEHTNININTYIVGGHSRARAAAARAIMLTFAQQQGVENAPFYHRGYDNMIERPEESPGKRFFVCVGPFGQRQQQQEQEEEESISARPRPHVLVVDAAGKSVVREAVTGTSLAAEDKEELDV